MGRLTFKPAHILAVYERAADDVRRAGMAWYHEAHALALELQDAIGDYQQPPRRGAGILAALSPQCPWPRNQALARLAIANGQASGTLGFAVRQANAILAGADPLDILKGPKVRSFFHCILDPFGGTDVCIDRHAAMIARAGRELPVEWALDTFGNYERAQDAYRTAALAAHIRACDLQAVTWVQWRIERQIDPKTGTYCGPKPRGKRA